MNIKSRRKSVAVAALALVAIAAVSACAPPPPLQNLVPTNTPAPPQPVTVLSVNGGTNGTGNPSDGDLAKSTLQIVATSDGRACTIVGFEDAHGAPLAVAPRTSWEYRPSCPLNAGGYAAMVYFDMSNYISGSYPSRVADWDALLGGKLVVRLADGTETRVPLPRTACNIYGGGGFANCIA